LTPQADRQLPHSALTHFDTEHPPKLVTQVRIRYVEIALQFSHNPQCDFAGDLGSLPAFSSIHQSYPMASALNVPTPQARDMLGVIRQSQVLAHSLQQLASLNAQDQLFFAQSEINLCLCESFFHRLSSSSDNR
jgi:hypothetical protein